MRIVVNLYSQRRPHTRNCRAIVFHPIYTLKTQKVVSVWSHMRSLLFPRNVSHPMTRSTVGVSSSSQKRPAPNNNNNNNNNFVFHISQQIKWLTLAFWWLFPRASGTHLAIETHLGSFQGRSILFPWDARGLPWARTKRHLVGGPFKFPLTEARACHMDVI